MKKYNSDSEVAWTLVGLWAYQKKDGSFIPVEQVPGSDYFTKPCVTYWDNGCAAGFLCGLGGTFLLREHRQQNLQLRILNGESVKSIKAEEPKKTNILLNKKRADEMNITFPADYLGSAYGIYKDYNGSY